MLIFLFGVLGVAMMLVLVRTALGPNWIDRVLAINIFGTLTTLLLALIAAFSDLPSLLDIALLYVLINFMSTVAILRFFKDKKLPIFHRQLRKRWNL